MEIQPIGYDGPIKVLVYLGPRIPSDETSVRDGVGFINFGDFKEQTEFGKVGAEINKRVLGQAYTSVDKEQTRRQDDHLFGRHDHPHVQPGQYRSEEGHHRSGQGRSQGVRP